MLERLASVDREPTRTSLLEALRARTASLHAIAERTGIVADILQRRASINGYRLLLRNLLPVYRSLEQALAAHRMSAVTGLIFHPGLARAAAIEADLKALRGPGGLPLLPEAARYAEAIHHASKGGGARLIAHAYARYLGDLSGGQILKKLMTRTLQLPEQALSFYTFTDITDIAAFKAEYRSAIERAGSRLGDCTAIVEEGAFAFELNIELSMAVQRAAASC